MIQGGQAMSFMFEVLYKSPTDPVRETALSDRVGQFGGRLTYREEPEAVGVGPICLTFEFSDFEVAKQAASFLRAQGEHVEGPVTYGDE
jgi:hypothetical protein